MIVLDANILIRAVMGQRVRELLETYASRGIRFYTPDVAFADAEKYLPPLLIKRGKPVADLPASLEYLQHIVESVDQEFYGAFETEARQRLRSRDEDDWPVLATALGLACAIWTEDSDFFGTGIAVLDHKPHSDFPPSPGQDARIRRRLMPQTQCPNPLKQHMGVSVKTRSHGQNGRESVRASECLVRLFKQWQERLEGPAAGLAATTVTNRA